MTSSDVAAGADCARLLTRIGTAANGAFSQFLTPAALTPRGAEVMLALRSGPQPQDTLAEVVAVHPVSLVSILNELESAGLVVRRRDARDRRRHTVSLSELGRARLAAVDIAREKLHERLFGDMSKAQRAALTTLLERIADNLKGAVR